MVKDPVAVCELAVVNASALKSTNVCELAKPFGETGWMRIEEHEIIWGGNGSSFTYARAKYNRAEVGVVKLYTVRDGIAGGMGAAVK